MRYFKAAGGMGSRNPAELAVAAGEGEPAAQAAWRRFGHCLGVGLGSLINVFSPQQVYIGGGLAGAHGAFNAAMLAAVSKHKLRALPMPKIKYCIDTPDYIASGAAVYASMAVENV